MGLLNAIPYAGYQSPWASLRQRYGQHESAHAAGGEGPKGPMPPAPDKAPSSFWDRLATGFQGLESNPMFTMGLSLLGNAQNGGNWSGVLEDMQGMGDRRRQQQILDNEMRRQKAGDAREETRFGREQAEWQAEDRQRSAYDRYLPSVEDPELRGILEAVGADNYGQVLSDERRLRIQREEAETDRALQERLSRARGGSGGGLNPRAIVSAREQFATANGLNESYNRFIEMLRNASDSDLAGIGPGGARLASAHRILALQAKSPAALDLGALVGADFEILNDILGDPGNIRQLLAQGGRDGALARLEPLGQLIGSGQRRLLSTYEPFAEEPALADYYNQPPPSLPSPDSLPPSAPSAPAPNQGGWGDFGRALGGLLGRPETPTTPTTPAPTAAPFSSGSGFNDRPRRPPRVEGLPPIQNRRVGTRYTWTVNGRQVSGTWNGRGFD